MRLIALLLIVCAATAIFAVPQQINYQGKLTDPDGVALEGVITITFKIYDVETGGTELWSESQDITISHGLFDVQLGSISPFPASLDFSVPYWLELSIGGETLAPRQPLLTVPYSFRAGVADSVAGLGPGGNNLDEAYDASPSGNKRIDADDGAVIIETGLFSPNGALSLTSHSVADAALYATNTAGGNAIWADENIYANNANIQAKGDINVIDAADNNSAGLVGATGSFWLNGRIDMKNNQTLYAENSSGTPKAILTPLNGADNIILSMADGNNFYIQDNTYATVGQFAGGATSLYLTGGLSARDAIFMPEASASATSGMQYFDSDDNTMYYFDGTSWVPMDGGADADWQIGAGVVYNNTDNIGIGTPTPDYALDVAGNAGFDEYIYHNDNPTTYIQFTSNRIDFYNSGLRMLTVDGLFDPTAVVVNENAANNVDFRVEGDTDTHLLFADANSNNIGIGISTPDNKLHVVSTGDTAIYATGSLAVYGRMESNTFGWIAGVRGGADSIGVFGQGKDYGTWGYTDFNNYGYLGDYIHKRGAYGKGDSVGVAGVGGLKGVSASGDIGLWAEGKDDGYAVFANRVDDPTTTNFVAIYGSDSYIGFSPPSVTGIWAGYFDGDVNIDGDLTVTGTYPGSSEWESAGSGDNEYKRPVFGGSGNDNVRAYEQPAIKGLYGRAYTDASNYAPGYVGYYGSDIGGVNRYMGIYGNSGVGTNNVAVGGRYNAGTYGFIGGQVAGNNVGLYANGEWASAFFGDYNDADCGERGLYAIGSIYGVFARDTSGGAPSSNNYAYLGYRDPNPPNYEYGILASGDDFAGYFDGDVYIDGKLTTTGGVDPTYVSFTPQGSEPMTADGVADPGIWIRSTDEHLILTNTSGDIDLTPGNGNYIQNKGYDDGLQSDAGFRIEMPPPPDGPTSVTDTIAIIQCQTTTWPSDNALYNLVSTIDTVSDGAGTALYGRLDVDFTTFTGRAAFYGASGHSYSASGGVRGGRGLISASKLETNYANFDVIGVGVEGRATGESLTPDAVAGTDRLIFAGITGEISGVINTPPTTADTFRCAAVWGVDNNDGTAKSYAGYFDGDVHITGELSVGKITIRGECKTNDATIQYRNTSGGSWDYQEERRINYGRSTSLTAGYWDYAAYRKTRTLIKFDLSDIPTTATINTATLKLYCYNVTGTGTYYIYKLRRHWSEGDNYCGKGVPSTFGHCDSTGVTGGCAWDYYSRNNAWGTAGADNTTNDRYGTAEDNISISTTGWKTWDITSAIQDYVDGTSENYGFIIIGPASGDNRAYFKSSECDEFKWKPELYVEWTQ